MMNPLQSPSSPCMYTSLISTNPLTQLLETSRDCHPPAVVYSTRGRRHALAPEAFVFHILQRNRLLLAWHLGAHIPQQLCLGVFEVPG